MQIKNKFKVGDEVYVIEKRVAKKECPECGGVSEVKVCNIRYICPCCNGQSKITDYDKMHWYNLDGARRIRDIYVRIAKNDIDIEYDTSNIEYKICKERDCFKTKEEAQKECDRRNKENV